MAEATDATEEDFCYICFESATRNFCGELEPLVRVCRCPTRVHRRCIARWQLYSAGKREEKLCRFCADALPDWREVLTPSALPPAVPVLSIYYNNTCCRMRVRPGPDGLAAFLRQLEALVGRDVAGVNFVFRCRCPDTGAEIFLQGLQAFEAAMHCACVRAAQRTAQQQQAAAAARQRAVAEAAAAQRAQEQGFAWSPRPDPQPGSQPDPQPHAAAGRGTSTLVSHAARLLPPYPHHARQQQQQEPHHPHQHQQQQQQQARAFGRQVAPRAASAPVPLLTPPAHPHPNPPHPSLLQPLPQHVLQYPYPRPHQQCEEPQQALQQSTAAAHRTALRRSHGAHMLEPVQAAAAPGEGAPYGSGVAPSPSSFHSLARGLPLRQNDGSQLDRPMGHVPAAAVPPEHMAHASAYAARGRELDGALGAGVGWRHASGGAEPGGGQQPAQRGDGGGGGTGSAPQPLLRELSELSSEASGDTLSGAVLEAAAAAGVLLPHGPMGRTADGSACCPETAAAFAAGRGGDGCPRSSSGVSPCEGPVGRGRTTAAVSSPGAAVPQALPAEVLLRAGRLSDAGGGGAGGGGRLLSALASLRGLRALLVRRFGGGGGGCGRQRLA